MLLRMLLIFFSVCILSGCKQVYIVSNDLSKSYLSDKEFFNDKYSDIKKNNTLFYIETGYFKEEEEKLVVFLNFDSLKSGIVLEKSELIINGTLFSSSLILDKYKEEKIKFDDNDLYTGGARLEFDVQKVDALVDRSFSLKIYFNDSGRNESISISIRLTSDRIWST